MRTITPAKVSLSSIDIAAVHQLRGCRLRPGSWPKRFARTIAEQVDAGNCLVTMKQLYWLWKLCYTFRRQIHGETLEEAIRRHTKPRAWVQGMLF